MLKEFKTFIARGNVLDLAVAVIIGAAFSRIVSSLTDDIIMPVIGKITGDLDFSNYFLRLGPVPANYAGSLDSYADLKKAGVAMIGYGQFITVAVNFLIVSFIIFMLIRAVHRLVDRQKREDAAIAAAAPAPEAADLVLLREIRDELRARR